MATHQHKAKDPKSNNHTKKHDATNSSKEKEKEKEKSQSRSKSKSKSNSNNNNNSNNNDDDKNEPNISELLEMGLKHAITEKDGNLCKEDLENAVCRSESMPIWAQVFRHSAYSNIVSLSLRWCALQSVGCKSLCMAISESNALLTLQDLDLMGNEIGVNGTRAIALLLVPYHIDLDSFTVQQTRHVVTNKKKKKTRYSTMRKIILSHNVTSDAGCAFLGKVLCLSESLKDLELQNCEIGDKGCKYLRRGIERNTHLLSLDLSANRFGEMASREIGSFLVRNNTMRFLDVSRNKLGPSRASDILKGLESNQSLEVLKLNMNRIGTRGCNSITSMLTHNHTLKTLEISYNELFSDGLRTIANGIALNHSLRHVVLWYNGLNDESANYITKAMFKRMNSNKFTLEMLKAVMQGLMMMLLNHTYNNHNSSSPSSSPKSSGDPENIKTIARIICEYTPVFMHFECDMSHNRRITQEGINKMTTVVNTPRYFVKGFADLLIADRKERDSKAQIKSSLY